MTPLTLGRDVFFTDPATQGQRRGREVVMGQNVITQRFGPIASGVNESLLIFDPLTSEHFFVRFGDLTEVPKPDPKEAP